MQSAAEPLVTWNLLLCVVAFPALGYYVKSLLRESQDRAIERTEGLKQQFDDLKKCLNGIKEDISEKQDKNECTRLSEEKWHRINKHKHTDTGEVVIT